jgi:hypothetical protein
MAELGQARIKMAGVFACGFIMGIESRLAMPDEQNLGHVGSLLIEFDMACCLVDLLGFRQAFNCRVCPAWLAKRRVGVRNSGSIDE